MTHKVETFIERHFWNVLTFIGTVIVTMGGLYVSFHDVQRDSVESKVDRREIHQQIELHITKQTQSEITNADRLARIETKIDSIQQAICGGKISGSVIGVSLVRKTLLTQNEKEKNEPVVNSH